ncbi:hypothetical protein LTR17_021380 [Elasticomyces elasticus]|nr:hypothetical protein LTR17_021380 [Elasticomyces elasticus]
MENSLFGKLSAELRNQIYKLVLHDPEGFKIFQHDGTHPDSGLPDGKAKGINLYFVGLHKEERIRIRWLTLRSPTSFVHETLSPSRKAAKQSEAKL